MKRIQHSLREYIARWQSWPLAVQLLFVGFLALQTLLFFFAGLPGIKNSESAQRDPFLRFVPLQEVSEYDATSEQALLFDTAPIFIPTPWNAVQQKQVREPLAIPAALKDFEPRLDLLSQMSAAAALEPDSGFVESPRDMLGSRFVKLYGGNLELPETMESFDDATPTAYYRNGSSRWQPLPMLPDLDPVGVLVNPVTFYININKSRVLLGLPRLASGSGLVAFDRAARAWLSSPEVLALLPVGYSEVVVYP